MGARTNALAALAAAWDQAAAELAAAELDLGDRDPIAALIGRGRARQLTDCADELRALIAKETK